VVIPDREEGETVGALQEAQRIAVVIHAGDFDSIELPETRPPEEFPVMLFDLEQPHPIGPFISGAKHAPARR
jgi:hypothetical protein